MERYQRVHYFGTLKETGREEDREERVGAGMN